jgi:hypothetical protein
MEARAPDLCGRRGSQVHWCPDTFLAAHAVLLLKGGYTEADPFPKVGMSRVFLRQDPRDLP